MKIGIIGIGCVGSALERDFTEKNIDVISYDKYKNNGIGTLEDTLECDIIFLCLPTLYEPEIKEYNKSQIPALNRRSGSRTFSNTSTCLLNVQKLPTFGG